MKIKIVFLILLIILLSSSIKAFKLSVSPAHLDFRGNSGEKMCKEIAVSSDEKIFITIEDKWASKSKDLSLNDYNLSSKQLEINVSYPGGINLIGEKNIALCITPKNAGTYNGILVFTSSRGLAGLAVLIKVEIFGQEEKSSLTSITGNIINLNQENNSGNLNLPISMFILSLILVIIFFIIVKKK